MVFVRYIMRDLAVVETIPQASTIWSRDVDSTLRRKKMPFDDYKCGKCGAVVSKYRKITETAPPNIPCEECKTPKITALMIKQIPAGVCVAWKGGAPTKRFH